MFSGQHKNLNRKMPKCSDIYFETCLIMTCLIIYNQIIPFYPSKEITWQSERLWMLSTGCQRVSLLTLMNCRHAPVRDLHTGGEMWHWHIVWVTDIVDTHSTAQHTKSFVIFWRSNTLLFIFQLHFEKKENDWWYSSTGTLTISNGII